MGAGSRLVRHPAARPRPDRPADPAQDPGVGDRRRPADARAVRPAPGDLRRLHRQRAGARRSSRTSSATRCSPATPTPTPRAAAPACRPPGCARTPGAQIHRSVDGDDDTVVIFCGSGTTAAIDKLVGILGIRIPADLDRRHQLSAQIPRDAAPVVFIGPYEHHSNELPWRESIADVVTIHEDADGHIDVAQLRAELARYADRTAEDRLVQRRLQRDRDRHRHPRDHPAPPRARRPRAVGLRRLRAVRRDRDEPAPADPRPARTRSSCRRTSSSAARHARRARRQHAGCSPTRSRTWSAAAPSPTSTRRSTATSSIRPTARRAARLRSSSRSAPGWSSGSRTPSA